MYNILARSITAVILILVTTDFAYSEDTNGYQPYVFVSSSNKKENVVEVIFQLDCPYCRKMHYSIKGWEAGAREFGVKLIYLPAVSSEKYFPMALAIESVKKNNPEKLNEFMENCYSLILDQKKPVSSFSTYYQAAELSGINRKELKRSIVDGGDSLKADVKQAVRDVQQYDVTNVPSLVVNGTYLTHVGFTNGNYELFFGLINGLVSKGISKNEK